MTKKIKKSNLMPNPKSRSSLKSQECRCVNDVKLQVSNVLNEEAGEQTAVTVSTTK